MGYYLPSKDAGARWLRCCSSATTSSVFEGMLEKQVAQTKFFENGGAWQSTRAAKTGRGRVRGPPHPARGKEGAANLPASPGYGSRALAASPDGFVRDATSVLRRVIRSVGADT